LKIDITDAYSKGKINEIHYNNLKNEISILYAKIFQKSIDALNGSFKENISKQVDYLKRSIKNSFTEQ